jgi:high-affinity iron transporter
VERLFWEGDDATPGLRRLLSDRASLNEIRNSRGVLDTSLAAAQAALNAGTAPAAVVFNAATIVFREGLEAVLILASLLASMIGANRQFKRLLAMGALVALAATALLFVLARDALLSFGRYSEQLEAIVSMVAIGVLLPGDELVLPQGVLDALDRQTSRSPSPAPDRRHRGTSGRIRRAWLQQRLPRRR